MSQQSTTVTISFTVVAPLLGVTLNPTPPPQLAVGTPISPYQLFASVSGGTPPYSYHLDPATPFPGMSVNSAGQLVGTPQQPGTVSVNVIVSDAGTP